MTSFKFVAIFVAISLIWYVFIVVFFVKGLSGLNEARETFLDAATTQSKLITRLPKNRLDKYLEDIERLSD
ncbi:MAG: hypothetical protein A2293_03685 [Elusimicrobia bacterium RIFOXYB2_FULL_49_7]|nr:MAG: hypothetical protein A2293_03685 [Elusimicrobia bacterium RIFOXYB2_FULL_49_7]